MRITLLVFLLLGMGVAVQAQQVEYTIGVATGLFKEKPETMPESPHSIAPDNANYLTFPHGDENGPGLQLSLKAQKVTRSSVLWGAAVSYQWLESKQDLGQVISSEGPQEAKGWAHFRKHYLAAWPFAGYRYSWSQWHWDVTAGPALAVAVAPDRVKVSASVPSTDRRIVMDEKTKEDGYSPVVLRLHLQTELGYARWGGQLGYMWGFFNGHRATMGGKSIQTTTRCVHLGLFYRLK